MPVDLLHSFFYLPPGANRMTLSLQVFLGFCFFCFCALGFYTGLDKIVGAVADTNFRVENSAETRVLGAQTIPSRPWAAENIH